MDAKGKPGFFFGFGGVNGGLWQPAAWIDTKLKPGCTSQGELLGFRSSFNEWVTLRYFFWSPNLVWFLMALGVWICFPYDIDAFKEGFPIQSVLNRLLLNFTYPFLYYAFWFVSLFGLGCSRRKFDSYSPSAGNMAHDLWYWLLGVVQFTAWECVMMRLWAVGAVSYKTNTEILASPYLLAINVLWVLLIPIWRDLHFYFAHRFIHIRCIYKYVHSLHHRNNDINPFSGLCMHPVEHMYYYSNAFTPSVFLANLSPMVFLWNFVHLVIAPGAGHSGWEDHWQADQYHYIHHSKFECNYGSPSSAYIDQFMGTFREKMGKSDLYRGEFDDKKDESTKSSKCKQAYLGIQTDSHLAYSVSCACVAAVGFWGMVLNVGKDRISSVGPLSVASAVAFVVAYGPVICAFALCKATNDRMSWRWPFQNENLLGSFGFFSLASLLACIVPVHRAVLLACA